MLTGIENSLQTSSIRLSAADSLQTQSVFLNLSEANELGLQNGQVIRGFLKDGELLLRANGAFTQQQFLQLSANLPYIDFIGARKLGGFQLTAADKTSRQTSLPASRGNQKASTKSVSYKFIQSTAFSDLSAQLEGELSKMPNETPFSNDVRRFINKFGTSFASINHQELKKQLINLTRRNSSNVGEDSNSLPEFISNLAGRAGQIRSAGSATSNVLYSLQNYIGTSLILLSQGIESNQQQISFPVFFLDNAPASVSFDLTEGLDLSQFLNLQNYASSIKGSGHKSEFAQMGDNELGYAALGKEENGPDSDEKKSGHHSEWIGRERELKEFVSGALANFKVKLSLGDDRLLFVDCAVNLDRRMIFSNVWVAGDTRFYNHVLKGVEQLAARFRSQELQLLGYNVFNDSPPMYSEQLGVSRVGNINIEA